MIRVATLVLACGVVCMAQNRPSYYPRPGGFSTVLSQFRPQNEGGAEEAPVETGDRNNAFQPAAPGSNNYLEDAQLNSHVQRWPQEKLPFWYINKMHIENHRGHPVPCSGSDCPQMINTPPRSSFQGSSPPRPSFSG